MFDVVIVSLGLFVGVLGALPSLILGWLVLRRNWSPWIQKPIYILLYVLPAVVLISPRAWWLVFCFEDEFSPVVSDCRSAIGFAMIFFYIPALGIACALVAALQGISHAAAVASISNMRPGTASPVTPSKVIGGATWWGPKRMPIRSKFFSASSTSVA